MNEYIYPCQRIWRGYKFYFGGAGIIRRGYDSTGVAAAPEDFEYLLRPEEFAAIFYRRGESILEHQAKTAWLALVFNSNFPDFFGSEVPNNLSFQSWQLIATMLCHDVGEWKIGDILDDDNHLHDTKDVLELNFFEDFVSAFSFVDRKELIKLFRTFQKKDSHAGQAFFSLDKSDAILTHLCLEGCGACGRISAKQNPSERDLRSVKITGSDLAADNWGFQAVAQFDGYPLSINRPIFTLLNVAANDVREENLSWAQDIT